MVVGLDDSEARRIVVVWGSCWRLLESGREYNLKSIICSDVHTSSIHHHIFIISRYIIPSYAHTYYIYKYIDRVDRISSSPYTYVYIYIYMYRCVPIKFNFVSLFVRLFGPIPILLQNDSHR